MPKSLLKFALAASAATAAIFLTNDVAAAASVSSDPSSGKCVPNLDHAKFLEKSGEFLENTFSPPTNGTRRKLMGSYEDSSKCADGDRSCEHWHFFDQYGLVVKLAREYGNPEATNWDNPEAHELEMCKAVYVCALDSFTLGSLLCSPSQDTCGNSGNSTAKITLKVDDETKRDYFGRCSVWSAHGLFTRNGNGGVGVLKNGGHSESVENGIWNINVENKDPNAKKKTFYTYSYEKKFGWWGKNRKYGDSFKYGDGYKYGDNYGYGYEKPYSKYGYKGYNDGGYRTG